MLRTEITKVVRHAMRHIARAMRGRTGFEVVATKQSGDPARAIDLAVERIYLEALAEVGEDMTVYSEESGQINPTSSGRYIAFVDPVDGTEMAFHQISVCSTSIAIMDRSGHLLLSVVGDVGSGRVFCADADLAYVGRRKLSARGAVRLADSLVANYSVTPDRMVHAPWFGELLGRCGHFINFGGPLLISKIADGTVDAVVEYQKGYHLYDLLAGYHIARNAGAVVTDLLGRRLSFEDLEGRYKFVASSNARLHDEILSIINRGGGEREMQSLSQ